MAFEDLRQFIAALESDGDLQRIAVPVDREWEVGAVCREAFDRGGPALIFERVGAFKTPLVVGVLATRARYARALGVQPTIDAFADRWHRAYAEPVPPREVSSAPCKEVMRGDVNFWADPFSVPRWHHLDGKYMLGTYHTVITRDPETGWTNLGTYRNAIFEPSILGIAFDPRRHGWHHFDKWRACGQPMPVAIAIGLDPYLALTTVSPIPQGVDDYRVAGGLKGAPIELVKAETSDLLVPARAEIVIEGEIPTDRTYPSADGPFGEFAGYMGGGPRARECIVAKLVSHRANPLFQGTYEGRPPNESTTARSISASMCLKEFLQRAGLPGIVDACVTEGGCGTFHAVVSIRKMYPGQPRDIISLAWGLPTLLIKLCTVVDDDVDVWNPQRVEWAVATRVQAARDVEIIRGARTVRLDPSKPPSQNRSDKMGIDATRPEFEYSRENATFPDSADPTPEHLEAVRARWADYGFGAGQPAPASLRYLSSQV
jgi:UbiD family decarboxylase